MFKLKRTISGISLGKMYEGARGIGYRLGILRSNIPKDVPASISTVQNGADEWYPGKERVIEESKRLIDEYRAKGALYSRR